MKFDDHAKLIQHFVLYEIAVSWSHQSLLSVSASVLLIIDWLP